jgi:hypothetical protein
MKEEYKQEFLNTLTDKEKTFYSEPMNQTLHARFESYKAGCRNGVREGYAQGFEVKFRKCGGSLISQSSTSKTMCMECLVINPERKDETVTIKHQR